MKDRLRGSKRASPLFYLIRIMPSQEVILIFSETLVHGRCFFYFIGNSEGTSYEIKSLRQDITYVFLLWYGAESRNTFS